MGGDGWLAPGQPRAAAPWQRWSLRKEGAAGGGIARAAPDSLSTTPASRLHHHPPKFNHPFVLSPQLPLQLYHRRLCIFLSSLPPLPALSSLPSVLPSIPNNRHTISSPGQSPHFLLVLRPPPLVFVCLAPLCLASFPQSTTNITMGESRFVNFTTPQQLSYHAMKQKDHPLPPPPK